MDKSFLLSTDITVLNRDFNSGKGIAVAVGGFDGVHLGHRFLLSQLVSAAKKEGLTPAVFTFDYNDSPKPSAELLASPELNNEIMADLGISAVFSAPFSKIRDMTASDFVLNYLYRGMGAKIIVCGYDFRFGKNREGDVNLIKTLLSDGVKVITPAVFPENGPPVSSTSIRRLISCGEIKKANKLLGREFSFDAAICHGAQLGRTLGFPTINQNFPEFLVNPPYGVYAVKVDLEGKTYGGIANFGIKPTVSQTGNPVCETYIFDYSSDCYGKNARVSFLDFIRPEQKFDSLDALKEQVERDKTFAKQILSKGELL